MEYQIREMPGKKPSMNFIDFIDNGVDSFVFNTSQSPESVLSKLAMVSCNVCDDADVRIRLERNLEAWKTRFDRHDVLDVLDMVDQIMKGSLDPISVISFLQMNDMNFAGATIKFDGILQTYYPGGETTLEIKG